MVLDYLLVFLVGGFICMLGQIVVIKTTFTPTRLLVSFLILGVVLELFGLYEPILQFAKAGISVPIIGFGAALSKGVIQEVAREGAIGALTGGLKATAGGIAAAVFFSFIIALIFDSKSKKF